jgi:hypothetical protein
MPQKLVWTGQRDLQIKRMRADRASWDSIALSLGISRNAAIERGRRIGARLPPPVSTPAAEDPDRPPLPPGHPTTWGLITAGTCLAGEAYVPPHGWKKVRNAGCDARCGENKT